MGRSKRLAGRKRSRRTRPLSQRQNSLGALHPIPHGHPVARNLRLVRRTLDHRPPQGNQRHEVQPKRLHRSRPQRHPLLCPIPPQERHLHRRHPRNRPRHFQPPPPLPPKARRRRHLHRRRSRPRHLRHAPSRHGHLVPRLLQHGEIRVENGANRRL